MSRLHTGGFLELDRGGEMHCERLTALNDDFHSWSDRLPPPNDFGMICAQCGLAGKDVSKASIVGKHPFHGNVCLLGLLMTLPKTITKPIHESELSSLRSLLCCRCIGPPLHFA